MQLCVPEPHPDVLLAILSPFIVFFSDSLAGWHSLDGRDVSLLSLHPRDPQQDGAWWLVRRQGLLNDCVSV